MFLMLLTAAVLAVSLGGCQQEETPTTPLEVFVARTGHLEGPALDDTLRAAMAEGPPTSVFAGFLIGNGFHASAADSAFQVGWHDPGVNTLLDSAETYFGGAVAQDSTFIEGLVNLGSVWDDRAEGISDRRLKQDAVNEAEHWYRRALAVDETEIKARCNLGGLFLRQRRTNDAVREFTTALEYAPESSLAHYNLAIMFAEAKLYREAIREFELAAEYDNEGDIGERAQESARIIRELMSAPDQLPDK
ncbi:MAG: tetratricopeptide repeat protein [bacterium]|nr:tetratricopeptide repeat protein [bacterium]